jgi:hypothetical protein
MNKRKTIVLIIILILMSSLLASANKTNIKNNNIIKENKNFDTNFSTIYYNDFKLNCCKGWSKIESSGIGFHIIYVMKILKFNAPIPTPQYHNFFPFKIDLLWTWCKYWDENASTIITPINGESIPLIKGNHSFIIAFLKIPQMILLRNLFADGIIDGTQAQQQFWRNFFGINTPPLINLTRNIIKKINNGDPFFNITKNETKDLLKALNGVVPRYDNWNDPVFTSPFFNNLRDNFPLISNSKIIRNLRFYFFMTIPGFFWNHSPIRMSFLHSKMTQKLIGYTPFVIWWDDSQNFLPQLQNVNELISSIIFQ